MKQISLKKQYLTEEKIELKINIISISFTFEVSACGTIDVLKLKETNRNVFIISSLTNKCRKIVLV